MLAVAALLGLALSCGPSRAAELFRLRSNCATLATTVYQREQRDRAAQAFPKRAWEMRSHYDPTRNRCYVAYRVADAIIGEHVVYDAQTNQLIAGSEMPLAGPGAFSGTIWIDGRRDKLATFGDFEAWVDKFMRDE